MDIKYNKNSVHYVVATGIIINAEGKYLITKRAGFEKAFPNQWTVPGGKLEVLDYALKNKDTKHHWYNIFEDLLKREVQEETSLEIKNIGYVTSMVYLRDDNIPCLIISLYCYLKNEKQKINLCHALTDYKWVTLEEAKTYDLIDGIYNELEILDNFLKTGQHREWKPAANYK